MFFRYDYNYYGWNWNTPSMYEVGKFFLSHKMVVRRCKNKRKGKRK